MRSRIRWLDLVRRRWRPHALTESGAKRTSLTIRSSESSGKTRGDFGRRGLAIMRSIPSKDRTTLPRTLVGAGLKPGAMTAAIWTTIERRKCQRCSLELLTDCGAISTDTLHFPARVLVVQAARLLTGGDPDPGHGSVDLLVRRAAPLLPASPADARARGVLVVGTMVTRPRRLTGMWRTTPIGLLQRVPGARRPRVIGGLPTSCPLFRSTSRQASVRKRPSA
jgi:hypothetical protein